MSEKLNKLQIINPRYDLLSGDIITFKNKDQYLNSFYSDRNNLVKHFKQTGSKEIINITKQILQNRIENKNIKYAPSTVECRSLNTPFPSPALVYSLGIDFNQICLDCNLITKYTYKKLTLPDTFDLTNYIIVDSREQEVLSVKAKIDISKLDFGDYALSTNLNNTLSVEKKSSNDLISTISKGFERFCKEMMRAEKVNSNILIVVSESLSSMLSFNYLPQFKWVKASPTFIFSRLRELLQNFPNIQIVFVKNKIEAANITRFALSFGKEFLQYDIQYLYDTKQLKDFL